jgi:uncharacterized protein involved in response to NO
LWLLLATALVHAAGWEAPAWTLLRGVLDVAAGGCVLWLAVRWSRQQNLAIRLLAMLWTGFVWLGAGLLLASVAPLAALHAIALGCLGSLMLAMVTRVSCAHSGRPVVVDRRVWILFWLLQLAAVLRIAAVVPALPAAPLLLAAAGLWAGVMLTGGMRHGAWYGCLPVDRRAR